jgi:c-di-GMP-binding flagellar brake protein YcgR
MAKGDRSSCRHTIEESHWRLSLLNAAQKTDRRSADRFPIEREVRYKVLSKKSADEAGQGRTINMSSTGILFTTDHMLLPGRRLELAISWPAQLNNQTPLKLVARGRVIRYEDGQAAIEIQQYEFRTSGKVN